MAHSNHILAEDVKKIVETSLQWHRLEGLNILVTGATGFIGSYIIETLAYLNEVKLHVPVKIYAWARSQTKLEQRFEHLLNRSDFYPVIQDVCMAWQNLENMDLVVHAASEASPKKYLSQPVETIKANTIATINILEALKSGKAKFLFLSSGEVYGNKAETSISEYSFGSLDPLHPRACYSESKRLAETLCQAYFRQFGVLTYIARISHTYGPGLNLNDGRVFTDLIADAIAGRDVCIHGDGLSSRPFCYITDLISGLFFILLNGEAGQAYNVGAEQETTILDLANLIINISKNNDIKVKFTNQYDKNIRQSGHFNIDKMKSIGWNPNIRPEFGFERLYRYFLLSE